jgi:hypothetical protein
MRVTAPAMSIAAVACSRIERPLVAVCVAVASVVGMPLHAARLVGLVVCADANFGNVARLGEDGSGATEDALEESPRCAGADRDTDPMVARRA